MRLNIPEAKARLTLLTGLEIIFVLQDKGHNKINDHRRARSKKRKVNEIHPDMCGSDTEFVSPPGANSKSLLLEPGLYFMDHFIFHLS
jgi:hypothetical protein